jgi:flagellar basal body rod protein FlgC
MIDLMAASNAYQANLTALSVVKSMITKTLELKK